MSENAGSANSVAIAALIATTSLLFLFLYDGGTGVVVDQISCPFGFASFALILGIKLRMLAMYCSMVTGAYILAQISCKPQLKWITSNPPSCIDQV